jgi:hypothetical protein
VGGCRFGLVRDHLTGRAGFAAGSRPLAVLSRYGGRVFGGPVFQGLVVLCEGFCRVLGGLRRYVRGLLDFR